MSKRKTARFTPSVCALFQSGTDAKPELDSPHLGRVATALPKECWMSPLMNSCGCRDRQRGAIGLMAALTMALALLCALVVVDSGRLYLEKRSLQRVADMAVLEAASRQGDCTGSSSANTYATQSATRNGFTVTDSSRTLVTRCGLILVGLDSRRTFAIDATRSDAIQVTVSHNVPRSIGAGIGAMFERTPSSTLVRLTAVAVAAGVAPVAALTIRNSTLLLNTANASILNPLIGGLLGGAVNLDAGGWQGLANGNINLLSYLNRLKTDINVSALDYTQVLNSNIAVSQLIQTAINVLDPSGTLGATAAVASLQALKTAAGSTQVVLGNLLNVQSGTNIAALNTTINLLDLVGGFAQVANKKNGLVATFPINLAGLAQVNARVQVIEPAQLSAIGNPSLASKDPDPRTGPNRIYVRTGQVRMLLNVKLPALAGLPPLINAASNLIGPLTPTVSNLLQLNLVGAVNSTTCLVGASCQTLDLKWLSDSSNSLSLDVSITAASAESYVTNYTCTSNGNKTLITQTRSSTLDMKIGKIDPATAFPANNNPAAIVPAPLPVLDIGVKTCKMIAGIGSCGPRTPFAGGGIGVVMNSSLGTVASTASTNTFASPDLPEINQPPFFRTPPTLTTPPSTLLSGAMSGVQVNMYKPTASNGLGDQLTNLGTLLSGLTTALDKVIGDTLTPLMAAVIDPLFKGLGVDVNAVDVGANLSCNIGQAVLVI